MPPSLYVRSMYSTVLFVFLVSGNTHGVERSPPGSHSQVFRSVVPREWLLGQCFLLLSASPCARSFSYVVCSRQRVASRRAGRRLPGTRDGIPSKI